MNKSIFGPIAQELAPTWGACEQIHIIMPLTDAEVAGDIDWEAKDHMAIQAVIKEIIERGSDLNLSGAIRSFRWMMVNLEEVLTDVPHVTGPGLRFQAVLNKKTNY